MILQTGKVGTAAQDLDRLRRDYSCLAARTVSQKESIADVQSADVIELITQHALRYYLLPNARTWATSDDICSSLSFPLNAGMNLPLPS